MHNPTLLGIAAGVLLATNLHAGIINVPGGQPTIQDGIDAAVNGDEVVVAIGTYTENINFNGKAITVQSSDGPDVTRRARKLRDRARRNRRTASPTSSPEPAASTWLYCNQ